MKLFSKFKFLSPLPLLVFMIMGASPGVEAFPRLFHGVSQRVCTNSEEIKCNARVVANSSGIPFVTPSIPTGYGPSQFHGAYQVPMTSANPATIGIVDAYNAPYIKSDLDTYNKAFGLPFFPSCSSTVKTSCFLKVNQKGQTYSYPSNNSGWALEISLDVEVAHQMCPNCKLVLVEARSASYSDLMAAVDQARLQGATVISNSYGSNEFSTETSYDSHFNYPGVAFLFSSGDSGYGASFPAASNKVTSVGGTTLNIDGSNNWSSESVWNGTGSGCSAYELKLSMQLDTGCAKRTIADVSADANPNTGAAVYDSYRYQFQRGWFQVGGTSLSAPLIAGIYAQANDIGSNFGNSLPYSKVNYGVNMHDITTGSNGACGNYLCQAAVGFDGPSGLGTPIGVGAF